MTEKSIIKERVRFFVLGALVVVGAMFLMGNKNDTIIDNGRYQLAAWGDGTAHGAFIIDTISGETKIAYRYKDIGKTKGKERNDLNKPFIKIGY